MWSSRHPFPIWVTKSLSTRSFTAFNNSKVGPPLNWALSPFRCCELARPGLNLAANVLLFKLVLFRCLTWGRSTLPDQDTYWYCVPSGEVIGYYIRHVMAKGLSHKPLNHHRQIGLSVPEMSKGIWCINSITSRCIWLSKTNLVPSSHSNFWKGERSEL